ncbi:MAG: hypothetical protein M1368_10960, partial [Thaumarchaeota archaeon]|nr:hypothetical protein [Nitrososphaerota archaeon]
MERDVLVILASRAARTFPLGILGVVLPIYLASFGSSILGLFFTISVVSSTSLLVVLSFLGHRFNIVLVLMIQTLFIAASLFMLSLSSTLILVLAAAAMSITNWAPGGGSGTGGGAYNTSVNILL